MSEQKEKEDLRMEHAAWVHREIHAILKELYHVSKTDLEKLDNTAFANVVEKYPKFSTVERIERSNVEYLYNFRKGIIWNLLGKRGVSDTLMEAIR